MTNRNLSPFNVGESLDLLDFMPEQVAELNQRHGAPLDADTVQRLFALIGGDPFLVRRALYLVARGRLTTDELFAQAIEDHGPFGDHLCRHLFRLHEDRELLESLRQVLARQTCADERTSSVCTAPGWCDAMAAPLYHGCRCMQRILENACVAKQHLYTVGGTVQAGSGLYIARQADTELLELCQAGTFAYVLSSRQMGKSSLMVRTSEQLMATGTHAVVVDLSNLGTQLTAEAWYLGLLTTIADSLMLSTDVVAWWQTHAHLGQTQRLTDFFQEVLLIETEAPVVVFIDEIDSTLSLPFTDDFYAAIRSVYNARALVPAFRRLSFVLLGVATPSDLISDPRRTPFNIGQRVEVTDFTYEEALPLADGFGLSPTQAQQVLHWVLDWTGGHPYLTQRLCRVMADEDRVQWSEADVAQMVARTFFGEQSEQDHNLQFVRDMLTERAPEPVRVLAAYRTIRQGRRAVRDEEQSLVLAHLKLSGVVRQVQRVLRVRNRIYETVFDLPWVREHWPVPWYRRSTASGLGIIGIADGRRALARAAGGKPAAARPSGARGRRARDASPARSPGTPAGSGEGTCRSGAPTSGVAGPGTRGPARRASRRSPIRMNVRPSWPGRHISSTSAARERCSITSMTPCALC